jgi:hypothetical protein
MSTLEIGFSAYTALVLVTIYFVNRHIRLITIEKDTWKTKSEDWKYAFEKEKEQCQHVLNKNMELEKKSKMSDDVLEILNDLKKGGALLEVTRVDRNDIFFHNGGLYR